MKGNTNKDLREKFLNEIDINKHEFEMFVTKDNDYKMTKLAKDYYIVLILIVLILWINLS